MATSDKLAVVPMRTQPMHLGHINLVKALKGQFGMVRVVIGNQPASEANPFAFGRRLGWWQKAMALYELGDLALCRGCHGMPAAERAKVYTHTVPGQAPVVVSGNGQVLDYWRKRGVEVLPVSAVAGIGKAHIPGIHPALLCQWQDNAAIVRQAMRARQAPPNMKAYLPPFVYEDVFGAKGIRYNSGLCD